MFAVDKLSLIILALGMGVQFMRRPRFVSYIKILWRIIVFGIFSASFFLSYLQYRIWKDDPFSRFLLPPHQNLYYFFSYVGLRIFAPWLVSLFAAIFISRLASFFNVRYGERFFEKEEASFIKLGIFLTGYPGFIFYIILILFIETLLSLIYHLRHLGRAPLYYIWLPVALGTILLKDYLVPAAILNFFIL